jgi:beta-lactamase superfamily II metal-dependent hydrolase
LTMLTVEDKITVLAEDFEMEYVLDNAEITKFKVFMMLYEEGLLDIDDFINTDNEEEEIQGWEE